MKINERRFIRSNNLRSLCIRQNWMTRMTNEQYDDFLKKYGSKNNLTKKTICEMAQVVSKYSTFGNYDFANQYEKLEHIMFEIADACHTLFEFVED